MASEVGYAEDALRYFTTALMADLDDSHGNTADGIHIASAGGTWLALVAWFAWRATPTGDVSFRPRLPEQWERLRFRIQVRGQVIEVDMTHGGTEYTLLEAQGLPIRSDAQELRLRAARPTAGCVARGRRDGLRQWLVCLHALPSFLRPRRVSGASGCDDSPVSVTALTSAEISLPAEADGQRVSDRIAVLADTVDVVGLTDNHAGQPRMSPLAAVALAREQGVGTSCTFPAATATGLRCSRRSWVLPRSAPRACVMQRSGARADWG